MTMSSLITNTPVNQNEFVEKMTHHWVSVLNNAVSDQLQKTWRLLAVTFNQSIFDSTFDVSDQWKVLQPPTGSGKTQGLIVYLTMLAQSDHDVGALIVVRLISQADDVVKQINELADREVAIAKHSETGTTIETANSKQVLVITHSAYESSLCALAEGSCDAFQNHMNFNGMDRSLVVIDEAIDVVRASKVELDDLRSLLGSIPIELEEQFTEEVKSLNAIRQRLTEVRKTQEAEAHKSLMLWTDECALAPVLPLIKGLKSQRWDHRFFNNHDSDINRKIKIKLLEGLNAADDLLAGFAWYAKQGKEHSLNTAKLILPEFVSCGVVLDATASQNLIWELFGEKAKVIATPKGVRDYSNVTLNLARQQGLGKGVMVKNAKQRASLLINDLSQRIPADRSVLVVCHKGLVPHITQYKPSFKKFSVTNWGATDGRNDWNNYDTVVIYGLPFRSPIDRSNTFMAFQGPQESEWLSSKELRRFNSHKDILAGIQQGCLSVSIIQGINRIRCRRVTDSSGSCDKSEVFLMLPLDSTGNAVLGAIKEEMPGIQEGFWDFGGFGTRSAGRPKKSAHAEGLLKWVAGAMAGSYSSTEVKSILGIPSSTWERMVKDMKRVGSELYVSIENLGASYVANGKGRRSYLVLG